MLVGIYGNYGAGNTGDELVGQGILNLIQNTTLDSDIKIQCVLFGRHPRLSERSWSNTIVYNLLPAGLRSLFTDWISTMHMIKACDVIIFGGGTLFTDFPNRAFHLWHWQFKLLKLLNKNIIIMGQSFGPLGNKNRIIQLKKIIAQCQQVTVRDLESYKLIVNKTNNKVLIGSDPIFAIPAETDIKVKNDKINIVVSLRPWRKANIIARKTAKIINILVEKSAKPILILALAMQDQGENDYEMLQYMQKYLHPDVEIQGLDPQYLNTKAVTNTIRRADFVIGMRLHANLLAINYRKNFIAIDYMGKTLNSISYLGLSDHVIDLEDWLLRRPDMIATRILDLIQNPDLIRLNKAHFKAKILSYQHGIAINRFIKTFNQNIINNKTNVQKK